jgi:Family of unknown function (DUF5923)
MTLQNAIKDTTEHPPKNAVAAPVNKQEEAADVDRKVLSCMPLFSSCLLSAFLQLRFYGAIEALRQGRYPSNQQIDSAFRYVLERSPVDQDQLSPEGRKLIQNCRDIIETASLVVQEKNSDELLQSFLWNTNNVDLSNAKKDPNELLVEKSKVQDDRRQGMGRFHVSSSLTHSHDAAACHLRTLGNLIATNSEVRKILSDFSVIGRDILVRTASHAAESVRPDQDGLTNVDRPAPPDRFEAAGGRQSGSNEAPVAELDDPGSNTAIRPQADDGAGVGHESQVRSVSQAADDVQGRVHEGRDPAQHSEITEIKAVSKYVPVLDLST